MSEKKIFALVQRLGADGVPLTARPGAAPNVGQGASVTIQKTALPGAPPAVAPRPPAAAPAPAPSPAGPATPAR
jgi:hypothetical protein